MTGFTANMLMLGREVNTPAHLMFPQSAGKYAERTEDYVADLRQNMQNAHLKSTQDVSSATGDDRVYCYCRKKMPGQVHDTMRLL